MTTALEPLILCFSISIDVQYIHCLPTFNSNDTHLLQVFKYHKLETLITFES
jgi:hypothetical protein